ncbi:MAG: MoaD family protein [Chloroflexi bacterium]|nr:MoaD family protein [Chloroflexota bacterium]
MAVEVRLTAVLQRVVGGSKTVRGEGPTVTALIEDLDTQYPGFRSQLFADDGKLHQFVRIYVNDEDIRYMGQLEAPIKDGDVVLILPALAGGGTSDSCRIS